MTESAHVRGQVWRPDGHAATDAVVTLTDPRGAQIGSSGTDANGAFAVPVTSPGRYLMVVAAPGHEPWVRYVTAAGTDVEMPVVLTESTPTPETTFSAFDAPATPAAPVSQPEPQHAPRPAPQAAPYAGFSVPPEPPAAHVASTPAQGFPPSAPDRARRQDETAAIAAQAALNAIAEGRPLPAHSLYGLVTALLASRIDLETDPSSALARTAARIGGTRGTNLPESQDAADAILAPLARQLLTDDQPPEARHVRRDDAADPENVIALLRPLIEALATDLESRTAR